MTITRERLEQLAVEDDLYNYPPTQDELNELARIALASLEADPVAYVDPHAFHNFSVFRTGETDNKRMGREWMWASPDVGLIPVYTAPPAPVVPDELLSAMEEVLRISDRDHDAWNRAKSAISDCRAAMQGKTGQVIQDGWQLVPIEPTGGMLAEAKRWTGLTNTAEIVYREMLAAAPQQEVKP